MKQSLLSAAAMLCANVGGMAFAEDLSVHVDQVSVDSSDMFMLSEADGVMRFESSSRVEARDGDASGFAGSTGGCFGIGRMVAGVMDGNGACSFTDPDGDIWQVGWTIRPGSAPMGEWWVLGGTGKWSGSGGGGVWVDEPAQDGTSTTHIDGVVMRN